MDEYGDEEMLNSQGEPIEQPEKNEGEEDVFDVESDGMHIKWKAFALLRKQFNRIERQK